MGMHLGGTGGEWADITIRPVSTDGAADRGNRSPRRRPPPDEPDEADEADESTPSAEAAITDSVILGRPAGAAGPDRAILLRVALLPAVRPLGLDLQTQWAALVEAATLQPAFRFWAPRRRDRLWRGGRRAARALPLGLPLTPCEAMLGCQIHEQPAPCCPPGRACEGEPPAEGPAPSSAP